MRRKALVFMILSLIALLVSCNAMSGVAMSLRTGYPLWYYEPSLKTSRGQTGFAALGRGETLRQAELRARTEIINQVSSYLGLTNTSDSLREFLALGSVEKWELQWVDYEVIPEESSYVVIGFAQLPTAFAGTLMTPERQRNEELFSEVKDLVSEGDRLIKAGKDLQGVSCYLQSMAISYGETFNDSQYSFDAIMDVVCDIIRSTRITLRDVLPENASCTVAVSRRESLVYETVQDCLVKAVYEAYTSDGKVFQDFFTYRTDRKGRFDFSILNHSAPKSGTVAFSLDFDSELSALSRICPDEASAIRSLVDSKTVSFSFDRSFSLGPLGVYVAQYDGGEIPLSSSYASDEIFRRLCEDSISCIRVSSDDDDENSVVSLFFSSNPQAGCLMVARIGFLETFEDSLFVKAATLEADVRLFDSQMNIIYDSDVIHSVGFGTDRESAVADSTERLCKTIYSLIKANYV